MSEILIEESELALIKSKRERAELIAFQYKTENERRRVEIDALIASNGRLQAVVDAAKAYCSHSGSPKLQLEALRQALAKLEAQPASE